MNELLEVFGRCHPLILHFPIGIVFGILVLELVALLRGESLQRGNMGVLVFLASFLAVVTAVSGLVLESSGEYGGETLATHKQFGIAVAGCALVFGLAHRFAVTHLKRGHGGPAVALAIYGLFLTATAGLMLPAGHFGARMTHGPGFVTAPLRGDRESQREPADVLPDDSADAPSPDATDGADSSGEPSGAVGLGPGGAGAAVEGGGSRTQDDSDEEPDAEPAGGEQDADDAPLGDASSATFAATIAPILEGRCGKCHGETRQKSGLKLTTAEGLRAGGYGGATFVAGKPEQSELIRRVRLPLEDEEHMPPEGKPQPTDAELKQLEAWILAGAPFEGEFTLGAATSTAKAPERFADARALEDPLDATLAATRAANEPAKSVDAESKAEEEAPLAPPSPQALAALAEAFVHVAPLDPTSGGLWVDFSAVAPKTDDALAVSLLEPLREHVVEVNLARTRVGADTLSLVARMPRLRRLDLRSSTTDSAALAHLGRHPALETLVLADTPVDSAAIDTLLSLPALRRVFLWRTAVDACAVERLRSERPEVLVDDGRDADAELVERDPLDDGNEAVSLEPVNAECPVSGSAVDARFRVVHDGKVIGFCCEKCPSTFWADPAKFADQLP